MFFNKIAFSFFHVTGNFMLFIFVVEVKVVRRTILAVNIVTFSKRVLNSGSGNPVTGNPVKTGRDGQKLTSYSESAPQN